MILPLLKKENISEPAFYKIVADTIKTGSGQGNHYFPVGVFMEMMFKPV